MTIIKITHNISYEYLHFTIFNDKINAFVTKTNFYNYLIIVIICYYVSVYYCVIN